MTETTIKRLRDGRTLVAVDRALYLDGERVNGLVARKLAEKAGDLTHYVPGPNVGLTTAEASRIEEHKAALDAAAAKVKARNDAARRERERKAQRYDDLVNEGADGYNPVRYDRGLAGSPDPTHKEDM